MKARGAAEHPLEHRTAPTARKYPAQYISSPEVGQACSPIRRVTTYFILYTATLCNEKMASLIMKLGQQIRIYMVSTCIHMYDV